MLAASPLGAQVGTAGGAWRRLPPPTEPSRGALGIEPATGRLVTLARELDRFVIWTFDRLGTGTWETRRVTTPQNLSGYENFSFDPVGRQFVSLVPRWTYSDTGVVDPETRLVRVSTDANPTWTEVSPEGPPPRVRRDAAIAIDPLASRMFLVGGLDFDTDEKYGDLWELQLGPTPTWNRIQPVGGDLAPRVGGSACYDPIANRLFVIGGDTVLETYAEGARAWKIDLGGDRRWTELAPAETLHTGYFEPPALTLADQKIRMLRPGQNYEPVDSTYLTVLDTQAGGFWGREPVSGPLLPSLNGGVQVAFDAARNTIVYVGTTGVRPEQPTYSSGHVDVWSLALGSPAATWTREYDSMNPNVFETTSPRALDAGRGQVHTWSAFSAQGTYTFRLEAEPGWSYQRRDVPDGRRRVGAVGIFDPELDRMLAFGGGDEGVEYGDLWQGRIGDPMTNWMRVVVDGPAPSARIHATAVHDPVRRRMVLFGGFAGRAMNDVWQLDLTVANPHWALVAIRGVPPAPRWGHTAVYDSRRDAMVVFGGAAGPSSEQSYPLNDVWSLSFGDGDAWVPLSTVGSAPPARYRHAALYDPVGDRMMILWGLDANGSRFDTATLEFGVTPRWGSEVPQGFGPDDRTDAFAGYDSVHDRGIILGGTASSGNYRGRPLNDAWAIDWNRADRQPPPLPHNESTITFLGVGPNPSRGDVNIAFEVPGTTQVRARIHDVRGRVVRDLGERSFTPGRHLVSWDGCDDAGGRVSDGVYFARVEAGTTRLTGKLVLMD